MSRTYLTVPMLALLLIGSASARDRAPSCDELVWSAQMLATNPDIKDACLGVYQKGPNFYAKVRLKLISIRGNRLSFRAVHKDGSLGSTRSIVVDNDWRATIDGRQLRAQQLEPDQELSVYIPEDRFALAMDDGEFGGDEPLIPIEDAIADDRPPE